MLDISNELERCNNEIAVRATNRNITELKKLFENIGYRIHESIFSIRSLSNRSGLFAYTKKDSREVYFTENPYDLRQRAYLINQFTEIPDKKRRDCH